METVKMNIIPTKFNNLLNGLSDDISASVGSTSAKVKPFLERNEAQFFPDYTDHGISHVQSVLSTCELLVGDEAWREFTRQDAAVLILATMAHDLGMLIDIDGFRYLLDPNLDDTQPLEPNDQPWEKLWQKFKSEVGRFDDTTLVNILGSNEPVSALEFDLSKATVRGVRIIGEFLRRHHHRLAHEIVIFGLPSGNGRVPLFDGASGHLREVAGIVARSHGLTLRNSIEMMTKIDQTGHREYCRIHPAFLMALIRLADYLDLDIGRAPTTILSAKTLRSPISKREWWSHRAIVNCHSYEDDPECLKIIVDHSAIPNVETFAVVEDKIIGIQQELDSCWAVLGETYGRFAPLNRLTLQIRRIRSNLHEASKVSLLPFVPHRASLKTARADLLKLLIEPLYGDHPGIGIRELIQNAIDAVRELDVVVSDMTSERIIDREELEGSVTVKLEIDDKGEYWVTVADRGIGMTYETIQNYYLTAGASFRQSDAWKKRFSNDTGPARVLRSGRFGVGILAAFLLGDRVQVTTRHIDEAKNKGICFEFGVEDTNIEMKWVTKKIGTTVKVRTTKSVIDRLMDPNPNEREKWDWYCLENPVVVRRDLMGNRLKQKHEIPSLEDSLPINWYRIQVPGFQAVDWSYPKWSRDGVFICNGIYISDHNLLIQSQFKYNFNYKLQRKEVYSPSEHLNFISPKVSVFDPDGQLPLNLARNAFAGSVDILGANIVDDMCRNFIAYCLIKGPKYPIFLGTKHLEYIKSSYPGFANHKDYLFFCTSDGFGIADPWNISQFTSKAGLLIRWTHHHKFHIPEEISELIFENYDLLIPIESKGTKYSCDRWHKELAITAITANKGLEFFRNINVIGMRILMSLKWYERFKAKQSKFITKKYSIESETSDWVIITFGECTNKDSILASVADELLKNRETIESVTEFYLSTETKPPRPGRIAQIWKKIIGKPIIPFDKIRRQTMTEGMNGQLDKHLEEFK